MFNSKIKILMNDYFYVHIESKFIQWKNENELAKEKGLLFKLYMDELV